MKISILVIATAATLSFSNAFADATSSTSSAHETYVTSPSKDTALDAGITASVKSAFLKEKLFGDADVSAFTISVETKGGVVHLTGTADNQVQADNAVKLAKSIEGVSSVVNDVKIKVSN